MQMYQSHELQHQLHFLWRVILHSLHNNQQLLKRNLLVSSTDLTDSGLTLIEDDINNCLHFAGSANTNSVISWDAN